MGGGPSSTTSSGSYSPPSYAKPYINQYLTDLGILDNPFSNQTLPGQSVAPLTGLQRQGLQMTGGEAGQAAQLGAGAAGTAGDILGGKYLDPSTNKYLNDYYNQAASQMVNQYQMATSPDITAQAVQQGGLGGSGQNQSQQYAKWGLGQNLGNLAAGIYEPAYQQGLNQMTSVLGMTPSLEQGAFIPSQGLEQAGALRQQQQQNVLNTQYQNAQNQFNWPYQKLGGYGSGVAQMAGLGGTQISTQPNTSQGMK